MELKIINALAIFAIYCVLSLLTAYFLGRKRQIGLGWSLFFCFFMNPFIGFIITMLSRKYYDSNPTPSKGKRIIGRVLSILGFLSAVGNFAVIIKGTALPSQYTTFFMAIGIAGLGYYLSGLGKGKNYNISALTKII